MAVSAELVKQLREKTGAGMMDCKKALEETGGDFEKAVEYLRKKGAAVAAKRAERTANEGLVLTRLSEDGKVAAIVEVNCETDFVARSDAFIELANKIADLVFANDFQNLDELLNANVNGLTVTDLINEAVGKIGEKIQVSRFKKVKVDNGSIVDYIHPGSKLGVLVLFEFTKSVPAEFKAFARDIAMQVAAMRPMTVSREQVDKSIIEKEVEIYKTQARNEGKPEQVLERIAQGKLDKFFQEICLLEQPFVKDGSKSVGELIKSFNDTNSTDIVVKQFIRYHLADEQK
ncbi:MAG: translation elongation factor Ts [Ignavibacteria bacterium]|nr:translation elongation factor Ts [Ignavibacteria bacterium]